MYQAKISNKNNRPFVEEVTPSPKRKRVVLDFVQKEQIIKKINLGFSHDKIAADFNIGVSTVYQILKTQNELASHRAENPNSPLRKVFKASDFPLVDHALKTWFYQERSKNNFLSMPILSEKAMEFYDIFKAKDPNMKPFKASLGYIQKFCARNNIKSNKAHGESLSANNTAAEEFVRNFGSLIDGYSTDQIYNADECGLNYRCLPTSSLTGPNEKQLHGYKLNKERVTMMLCANASGEHKLPLVFIHKYSNPKCFSLGNSKSIKPHLPVYYTSSKNAWMDQTIFENWFQNEFVPKVRKFLTEKKLEPKALLLLDNCQAHPMDLKSSDGKIECVFFPPNCTSLIQPMDQGPISVLKRKYRTRLLNLLIKSEQPRIEDAIKRISIKNVIDMVSELWEQFPLEHIQSSWHKLNLNLKVSIPIENVDLTTVRSNLREFGLEFNDLYLQDWLANDSHDPGFQLMNDHEIIEAAINLINDKEAEESDESEIEDVIIESKPTVSYSTAIKMCEELTKFCIENDTLTDHINSALTTIKSIAAKNREISIKQSSINNFFKPKVPKTPDQPVVSTSNVSSISIVKRNLNF